MLLLDLPFLLLELDFAELLLDFALALLEVGLTELLDLALLELDVTELDDLALLELDLAELEEFGGFTDELLTTLEELMALKFARIVVSFVTKTRRLALVRCTSSCQLLNS